LSRKRIRNTANGLAPLTDVPDRPPDKSKRRRTGWTAALLKFHSGSTATRSKYSNDRRNASPELTEAEFFGSFQIYLGRALAGFVLDPYGQRVAVLADGSRLGPFPTANAAVAAILGAQRQSLRGRVT
jgi:hypothetical protein